MASEGGAPREMLCTPFGHIGFAVEIEMQTESFMIHSADICEVVDRYRKEIETMKSKGVTSQYVKLLMIVVKPYQLLTEEDRVIEATEGVVAAYVHTLETWIGEPNVSSVEQFLRNHKLNRED